MNSTLPPLPEYQLRPLEPLIPGIRDDYLSLALLVVAYWSLSGLFHIIDVYDLFPQYRLHTPEEVLKRNHVSRWDVFRDVILQQVIQTIFGVCLGMLDGPQMTGREGYDIAVWARRLRIAQHALPGALAVIGLDTRSLSNNIASTHPVLSGVLAGGKYAASSDIPQFASWELTAAKAIYYLLVPALQFVGAVMVVDTWQYFWHRAMHTNKWMYTQLHSRHHRLYVPYAYGALYNHPVEGFILDTLGSGVAYLVTGMTVRQGMCFFIGSTFKTVDDHCGYALPWDPLQHITSNNAGYHDVHHQSWGIKNNFSQPFFTFWDGLLGTKFTGDTSLRYERDRKTMERRLAMETNLKPVRQVPSPVQEEPEYESINGIAQEKDEAAAAELRRSPRKRTPSSTGSFAAPIQGIRSRMNTSLHGKGSAVLGVESTH